jgi:stage II sporulation protein E
VVVVLINKSEAYPMYNSYKEAVNLKSMVTVNVLSFLLARAFILGGIMPFGVAFFSAVILNRYSLIPVLISIIAGVISIGGLSFSYKYMLMIAAIFLFTRVFLRKKALKRYLVSTITILSMLGVSMGWLYIKGDYTLYQLFIVCFEAFAAGILLYIFDYALPVIIGLDKRKLISREEIICIAVTCAIAVTGLGNIQVLHVSVKVVIMAVLILVSGYIGGAATGSAVGAVFGVVSGLTNSWIAVMIGVYAFAGLLAGTFKELGKLGSVLGFIIGSAILNFYLSGEMKAVISMQELLVTSSIFFLIPNKVLEQVSGITSMENVKVKNRAAYNIRAKELTAIRLKEFAKVFGQLSATFSDVSFKENFADISSINRLFDGVCNRVCKECSFYRSCWEKEFYTTYQSVFRLISEVEENGHAELKGIPENLRKKCIKPQKLIETINYLYDMHRVNYRWQVKMEDCRKLVSQQLEGISQVIENLAGEIDLDLNFNENLEENIYIELDKQGIEASQVMVLEKPQKRLEIYIDKKSCYGCRECVKKVIPIISDVTGKKFNKPSYICNIENDKCTIKLVEAQRYNVSTGVYTGPKDENQVSGDNYTFMELKDSKYLLALSDGMGTGESAAMESSVTINLLEQLLEVGYDHELAVKTINSILMLRSAEDNFSTLDISFIDLYTGEAKIIKIGAPPTYIKREDEVREISASSLPVGIINQLDVQVKRMTLKDGDFIVMITDGVYDAGNVEGKGQWIEELLKNTQNRNPQEIARIVFEKAMELYGRETKDDMTVLVSRIWEY